MSRRTQFTLSDRQHAFLVDESIRTGRPMAEIVRRLIDAHVRTASRWRLRGYELEAAVRRVPDAGGLSAGWRDRSPRRLDAR